jgi:hypothetical protein
MKPYVYKCTHRETGEFYIGLRFANKVPASEDLGIHYFTSSKNVKLRFAEFEYEIIQEFESKEEACIFEQKAIKENWKNPKLLNESHCGDGIIHFSIQRFGDDNPAKRPEVRAKIKEKRALQAPMSDETKKKLSEVVVTSEKRKNLSIAQKIRFEDPIQRANNAEILKKANSTKIERKKALPVEEQLLLNKIHAEKLEAANRFTEDVRAKMSKKAKGSKKKPWTEERKRAASERKSKQWQDHEFRKKMVDAAYTRWENEKLNKDIS